MSEGSAEGGAPLSEGQFGEVTETGDIPPTNTAQNPGSGVFYPGWYQWAVAQRPSERPRRRKKRKRSR